MLLCCWCWLWILCMMWCWPDHCTSYFICLIITRTGAGLPSCQHRPHRCQQSIGHWGQFPTHFPTDFFLNESILGPLTNIVFTHNFAQLFCGQPGRTTDLFHFCFKGEDYRHVFRSSRRDMNWCALALLLLLECTTCNVWRTAAVFTMAQRKSLFGYILKSVYKFLSASWKEFQVC